ncbi:hypothetical protein BBP40_012176 [Aspergillus hancockii]|nr:hypothetical protein BBP40_012176 [Aspergillus hancockii]
MSSSVHPSAPRPVDPAEIAEINENHSSTGYSSFTLSDQNISQERCPVFPGFIPDDHFSDDFIERLVSFQEPPTTYWPIDLRYGSMQFPLSLEGSGPGSIF